MTIENLVLKTRFSTEKAIHRNLPSMAIEDCDMQIPSGLQSEVHKNESFFISATIASKARLPVARLHRRYR